MRPTPDPFRNAESGRKAIAEALDAIDKMERDARERREKATQPPTQDRPNAPR